LILAALAEAQHAGARLAQASRLVGLSARTIERWRARPQGDDRRRGPHHRPGNALSAAEELQIVSVLRCARYAHLSPKQLVPQLADQGVYLASESTIYRLQRRLGFRPRRRSMSRTDVTRASTIHRAFKPNQVWSWDITWLPTNVRGVYLHLYLVMDVWSRKIVGWRIAESSSAQIASRLITQACLDGNVDPRGLVLHSDNGKPMRASTMIATLQWLGVIPSFSRPHVSDDKAIAEGLVKILMRYVRFRYRHTPFTSLANINQALGECVERINARRHTRFGVSRRERFETVEKSALKPLPLGDLEYADWKDATLHPDCYVYIEGDYYSAPHIHRHKKLRIKITENQVEIFLHLERLAIHPRSRHRNGKRVFIDAHFPPASQAYYEATPQKLLSQSRFIHPDLNQLFVELFNVDVFGHLRRCQGFVRSCTKEINTAGHELASLRIAAAIATMRRYNKFRVPYFQALLAQARKQTTIPDGDREIVRRPGNPMLRYVGGADQLTDTSAAVASTSLQGNLKL
jgi:putative transposase